MNWFRRKKEKSGTTGENAPAVPLEGYLPILHRAMDQALNFETLGMKMMWNEDFGQADAEASMAAFKAGAQQSLDELKSLQNAVAALFAVRPSEPELGRFHQAALHFANAAFSYSDAANSAFLWQLTSNAQRKIRERHREAEVLEKIMEDMKLALRREIEALYSNLPELYYRLEFSEQELYGLDLSELAETET